MLNIRKATIEDKQSIIDISKYIWDGDDYIPNVVDSWIDDNVGEFTIAEFNGEIKGFAKLTVIRPREIWLEGIRADKNFRGHGIGDKITKYYIEKAKGMEYDLLALATYVENYESIKIIERNNFIKTTLFRFFYKNSRVELSNVKEFELVKNIQDVMYIFDTKEMRARNNYLSFDWTFIKATEELLQKLIDDDSVYVLREDGEIKSTIILSNMKEKGNGISLSYIDGQEYYLEGIKFALSKYQEEGYESLTFMCPEMEELMKSGYASGMDNFGDYSTDAFVYEYDKSN